MLPRSSRLTATADIQEVVRSGQCIATPWVRLYYKARPNQLAPRAACVVGKKVHSLATVRHRHQRWLRELSRTLIPTMPTPYDIVLVAQPAIITFTTPQQHRAAGAQLAALLDKAGLTGDN